MDRLYYTPKSKIKEYRRDFKKAGLAVMFVISMSAQSGIVAAGNENFTVGEVFQIMQTVQAEKVVNLSRPKFEIIIEQPKAKKLTFWQWIKKIFNF